MNRVVRALCLVIGLALARVVVGAPADGAGSRAPEQPVVEAPQRPGADDDRTPELPKHAGETAAPALTDEAAPARRSDKSDEPRQASQRDSLWLLLLQVLRSPR